MIKTAVVLNVLSLVAGLFIVGQAFTSFDVLALAVTYGIATNILSLAAIRKLSSAT